MKKYFRESIKIVLSHLILVGVLALTSMTIGNWIGFSIINVIIGFIFSVIVYGRFTEIINGDERTSFIQIFKKHGKNYFKVLIIIGIATGIATYIASKIIVSSPIFNIACKIAIQTFVAIITVYVYPIVFLYRKNANAIPIGVEYLIRHLEYSALPIILTIAGSIIKLLVTVLVIIKFLDNIPIAYILFISYSFLSWIITLTVFNMVTMFLLNNSSFIEKVAERNAK